jgi:hypothetical protein
MNMNRPRLYGALRITASAACGLACVLVVVLWIRSDWHPQSLGPYGTPEFAYVISSSDGEAFLIKQVEVPLLVVISVPYWAITLVALTFTAVPWLSLLPIRFSLRTLLIAVTLVAVGMGVVGWLVRG